jgi:hypothetical protein
VKHSIAAAAVFLALTLDLGGMALAGAGPSCAEKRPVKKVCFCECSGWDSSTRSDGVCEVAERINVWCAFSDLGRTGSLGKDSIPSNVKDTSVDLQKAKFKVDGFFSGQRMTVPDYRTEDYANLVNRFSFNIIPPEALVPTMLKTSAAGAKDGLPADLAMTLFLWARGGYISLSPRSDVNDEEVRAIDDAVGAAIFGDPNVFRTFFAGSADEPYRPNDTVDVSRGYLRIDAAKDVKIKVIFRELLPPE